MYCKTFYLHFLISGELPHYSRILRRSRCECGADLLAQRDQWHCVKEIYFKHTRNTYTFIHTFSSSWDGGLHILKALQLQPPYLVITYLFSLVTLAHAPELDGAGWSNYCAHDWILNSLISKDMHFFWHVWCHFLSLYTVYVKLTNEFGANSAGLAENLIKMYSKAYAISGGEQL